MNQADGTITLTAPASGSAGNGIALTADWGSFAVSNLTGGATGVPATATLTLPAGAAAPTPGQTVTIGGTTYTFENSITTQSSANNVLIGGSAQTALAHLVEAIGKGANEGTDYATGTVQNPDITVSASTDTTATLQASSTGTGNATPVSTNWAGVLFAGGDLAGGVNGQLATGSLTVNQPLPTAGETVTIGGTTYTFVTKRRGPQRGEHRSDRPERQHAKYHGQLGGRHQRHLCGWAGPGRHLRYWHGSQHLGHRHGIH